MAIAGISLDGGSICAVLCLNKRKLNAQKHVHSIYSYEKYERERLGRGPGPNLFYVCVQNLLRVIP